MTTTSYVPNAKQQFLDANGNPVSGGSVYMYVVGTTTYKNTWKDSGGVTLNTNPVLLDSAGEAVIYGNGNYRQVVYTSLGTLVWDQNVGATDNGLLMAANNLSDVANAATALANLGGVALTALNTLIPVGMIATFAMSAVPTGWHECNGAALSRVTYATLFAAIGTTWGSGDGISTFNIPDMRGYFARGWDHGAGVDPARTIASSQTSGFTAHTHAVTDAGHVHAQTKGVGSGTGSVSGFIEYNTMASVGMANTSTQNATTGITLANTGTTETRPINKAVMYCIKSVPFSP